MYFLATPHHGASSAQLLSNIIRATNSGSRPFIDDLREDSPAIQAINEEFGKYANNLDIYSFFEARRTSFGRFGMFNEVFIVPKLSAQIGLPHERVTHLDADHRGVCKFETPSDPNFITVKNALTETLDRIRKNCGLFLPSVVFRLTLLADLSKRERLKTQKKKLREFLGLVRDLSNFNDDFEESCVDWTCEWLVDHENFRKWRDLCDSNVFWLSGNPATGKTFLSRYVKEHLERLRHDCSCFFFQAGNSKKSTLSQCLLYLTYQMGCASSGIGNIFFQMQDDDVPVDVSNHQSIWNKLFLGGIFQADLNKTHCWVIDALDECKNGQDLIPLLSKIDPRWPLRVFFPSRPSLEIPQSLKELPLSSQGLNILPEYTCADIRRFVENHTDFPSMQDPSARERLTSSILQKSEGCFLWVALVLKELKKVHSKVASQQILDDVPQGMNQLFDRILKNMASETYAKPLAKAILKWTICAVRPLSVHDLKIALELDVEDEVDDLELQVSQVCGNLVYVELKPSHHVRMIHETGRSFLLNPMNKSEFAFDERIGHRDLALTCLRCLLENKMRAPKSRRPSATLQRSAFVDYSAQAFSDHINVASSTDEELFLQLYSFSSLHGNVLSWIEYIALGGDLSPLIKTGIVLKTYLRRRAKHLPNIGKECKILNI